MSATPILRTIFQERLQRWGREDDGYTFDGGGDRPLDRVDVFVYRAGDDSPMTTFATIGMASRDMPGGGLAELHCAVRGSIAPEWEGAIATQLANLACYPWSAEPAQLGWGHMVSLPRDFPGFTDCDAVFLSGPFTEDGWGWIEADEGKVQILNVVPITPAERETARTMNPALFMAGMMIETDIFSPRPTT